MAVGGALLLIGLAGLLLWRPAPAPTPGATPTTAPRMTPTSRISPTTAPSAVASGATALPAAPATALPAAPALAPFFDDRRFTYEPGFYAPQIQTFLDT